MNEYFNKLGSWNLPKPGETTLECPRPTGAWVVGFVFSLALASPSFGGIMWQGTPTAVTYKVTWGTPRSMKGRSIPSLSPTAWPSSVNSGITDAENQTSISFSLNSERPFLYTGGSYTTTASGSATFSVSLAGTKSYVTIFSLSNASIYTQSGFVTPAGTADATKAPGNVPITNSPTINLVTDTTKPWTLTPNVGYDLTDNVLVTVEGLS